MKTFIDNFQIKENSKKGFHLQHLTSSFAGRNTHTAALKWYLSPATLLNALRHSLTLYQIFHPIYRWYRGPFTGLFIRFLRSNIKITAKFTILGYIGTYYAIGLALPLTLTNYLLTGWIADQLDKSYLPSWDLLCGTLFIFLLISPIAFAWYRHRLGEKPFFWALVEAFTWMPFFCTSLPCSSDPFEFHELICLAVIFFAGLSWHICYALMAHLFTLPIAWSSTAKELEDGGFFVSARRVFKFFGWCLLFMVLLIGLMIYLALYAPPGWEITSWTSILPLANLIVGHCMLPVFTIIF